MHEIIRSILEQRHTYIDQFLNTILRRRCAEEDDLALVTVLAQLVQSLTGEFAPFEHVKLRLDNRRSLRNIFVRQSTVREKVLRTVALKFHRIGACIDSRIDGAMRQHHIPVVIDANLGHHHAWLILANQASPDSYDLHKEFCRNLTTREAPWPSINFR